MSGVILNVTPTALRQTATGINGVIQELGGYEGQLGRGFDELALTGEQMSHVDAKGGMDNFAERWEWGIRALITAANDIGRALDLGAGMYELQEDYFNDAGKDMVNDLLGDPSLQKETLYNSDGSVAARGTDDMSWGGMVDHNLNRLANPDWSAQSFKDAAPTIEGNLESIQDNALQASTNFAVPGAAAQSTAQGLTTPTRPTAE